MNQNEIKQVLRLHGLWIKNDPKGQKAILMGADLTDADLRNANLTGADLTDATLTNAILEDADLRSADLWSAYLRNANLKYADLSDAYLEDANLEGADLRYATLSGASLKDATFDKETKFPEGFDPVAHGMILVGEKAKPSPVAQEAVAAVPAATTSTLHEELSAVLAKHGLVLGKNCIFSLI